MPDQLKALTSKLDTANARRHRLTGEPILPVSEVSKRWSCPRCWWTAPPMRPEACPECNSELVEVIS